MTGFNTDYIGKTLKSQVDDLVAALKLYNEKLEPRDDKALENERKKVYGCIKEINEQLESTRRLA